MGGFKIYKEAGLYKKGESLAILEQKIAASKNQTENEENPLAIPFMDDARLSEPMLLLSDGISVRNLPAGEFEIDCGNRPANEKEIKDFFKDKDEFILLQGPALEYQEISSQESDKLQKGPFELFEKKSCTDKVISAPTFWVINRKFRQTCNLSHKSNMKLFEYPNSVKEGFFWNRNPVFFTPEKLEIVSAYMGWELGDVCLSGMNPLDPQGKTKQFISPLNWNDEESVRQFLKGLYRMWRITQDGENNPLHLPTEMSRTDLELFIDTTEERLNVLIRRNHPGSAPTQLFDDYERTEGFGEALWQCVPVHVAGQLWDHVPGGGMAFGIGMGIVGWIGYFFGMRKLGLTLTAFKEFLEWQATFQDIAKNPPVTPPSQDPQSPGQGGDDQGKKGPGAPSGNKPLESPEPQGAPEVSDNEARRIQENLEELLGLETARRLLLSLGEGKLEEGLSRLLKAREFVQELIEIAREDRNFIPKMILAFASIVGVVLGLGYVKSVLATIEVPFLAAGTVAATLFTGAALYLGIEDENGSFQNLPETF